MRVYKLHFSPDVTFGDAMFKLRDNDIDIMKTDPENRTATVTVDEIDFAEFVEGNTDVESFDVLSD